MLKKIKTKQEIEKKRKRNQILLGGGLVLLLLLSTAGFSLMNTEGDSGSLIEERGLQFYPQGNYWLTEIQGQAFLFQNLPSQVSEISVKGFYGIGDYSGKVLYFTELNSGANEIVTNLSPFLLRYQEACLEGVGNCEEGLPVKSCQENLIIFIESEENEVWREENCVYIKGDPVLSSDAFLYKILGII